MVAIPKPILTIAVFLVVLVIIVVAVGFFFFGWGNPVQSCPPAACPNGSPPPGASTLYNLAWIANVLVGNPCPFSGLTLDQSTSLVGRNNPSFQLNLPSGLFLPQTATVTITSLTMTFPNNGVASVNPGSLPPARTAGVPACASGSSDVSFGFQYYFQGYAGFYSWTYGVQLCDQNSHCTTGIFGGSSVIAKS